MSVLQVALVNFSPVYGQVEKNIDLIERQADALVPIKVDMLCLPEMCLTGYSHSSDIIGAAQTRDGQSVRRLQEIAQRTGIALIAGIPELEPKSRKLYISQLFCTPEGQVFFYRKIHLSKREKDVFRPGHELGVFSSVACTIGLQLCFDAHFPEFGLAQALAGAQVMIICSASPMGPAAEMRRRWLRYLPARAYDSGCYVVTCNQHGLAPFGTSFSGMAMAFNPDGELIAESEEGDRALIVNFDLDAVITAQTKRPFIRMRRPDIYYSA